MSDTASIFREASLAPAPVAETKAEPLRLRRGVTRWGFAVLLLGLAAAGWLASVVHVDERAVGEATFDGRRTAIAVLPVAVGDQLRPGMPVRVSAGGEEMAGSVVRVRGLASASEAHDLLGRPAGRVADSGAVAVATVRLDSARSTSAVPDRVEVTLGRRTLAQLVLPRLRSAIRRDG